MLLYKSESAVLLCEALRDLQGGVSRKETYLWLCHKSEYTVEVVRKDAVHARCISQN